MEAVPSSAVTSEVGCLLLWFGLSAHFGNCHGLFHQPSNSILLSVKRLLCQPVSTQVFLGCFINSSTQTFKFHRSSFLNYRPEIPSLLAPGRDKQCTTPAWCPQGLLLRHLSCGFASSFLIRCFIIVDCALVLSCCFATFSFRLWQKQLSSCADCHIVKYARCVQLYP